MKPFSSRAKWRSLHFPPDEDSVNTPASVSDYDTHLDIFKLFIFGVQRGSSCAAELHGPFFHICSFRVHGGAGGSPVVKHTRNNSNHERIFSAFYIKMRTNLCLSIKTTTDICFLQFSFFFSCMFSCYMQHVL